MKKLISLVICFMLVFTMYRPAFSEGDTITWTGEVNNSWHEAGNWTPQKVPGPGDTAVIPDDAIVIISTDTTVTLDCSGEVTVEPGVNLTLTGTNHLREGTFDGPGNITITGEGSELVWFKGGIDGEGTMTVDSGARLVIDTEFHETYQYYRSVTMYRRLINNGHITVDRGELCLCGGGEGTGSFTIAEDAWLSLEEGEFDINGDLYNEGFFVVWSDDPVNFNADYSQGSTGSILFKLLEADSENFNKICFNGNVELNGYLELMAWDYVPGVLPSPGNSFEIMTYGSRTGEFTEITITPLGIHFEPIYGDTSLILTIPEDDIPPELIDTQPAHGEVFPMETNIERLLLEFSEQVWGGSSDTEEKKLYIYEEGQENPIFELALHPYDDWPIMYGNGDSLITVEFRNITLESGKTYYILIDEGAFMDWAGNRYPGISDSSTWSFSIIGDTQPPTTPANLRCASKNSSKITLQWDPSTDDYGTVRYQIYGKEDTDEYFVYIGETSSTTYSLTKLSSQRYLSSSTTYVFYVQAVDDEGNESEQSNSLSVTTSPPPQLHWHESLIEDFVPGGPFSMYYDFTYGDGNYYAVGTYRTILSNNDLINTFWNLEYGPITFDPELKGVAYSNGRLVAVGGSSVYSKTAGGEWTISYPGSGTATLEDIAVGRNKETGGDIFVAVGRKQIWWSDNGVDWESCTLPSNIRNSDCRFYAVEADEQGNFIAVGCIYDSFSGNSTLLICKSTNGRSWYTTLVSSATGQLTGLAYGNGTFVASGGSVPEVLISNDIGSSWVRSETTGTTYTDIAYGNGLFVGVGGKNIYISENEGHTWYPAGEEFEFYLRTIDFCNGTFLLAGEGNKFFYAIVENDEPTVSAPSAPQNLTAESGDGQVTLIWDPPQSDGGDSITHYEVSCDDGLTWVVALSNSTHTFTNLTNGVEYTFKVRAVNSVDHGAAASIKATPMGEFAGGSGTEDDPYLISTVNHLNNVRSHLDKHFRLIADLNMGVGDHRDDEGWEPIGTQSDPFTGSFDGDGHTISNLYIDRITEAKIGLFGYTEESATILDLILENVSIRGNVDVGSLVGWNEGVISKVQVTGNVTGRGETGGLVGTNYGLIIESQIEGTVTDIWGGYVGGLVADNYGRITKCHADVVVTSGSSFAGGLVGSNYGVINTSSATGTVEGSSYVGGLVGSNNDGNIDICYATGTVTGTEDWINYTFAGGLVGYNRSSITNSYARGNVFGTDAVGGLVGYNANIGTISNCYSTGNVGGSDYVGGLVGYGHANGIVTDSYWDIDTSSQENSFGGTGRNTDEMKQRVTYENWDFADLWGINDSDNDGYPFLRWQGYEAMPVVPSKPLNFTATPGDGRVDLSWDAPDDEGESGIIYYEVCKDGDADWTNVGLNTSYTFTGLTNGVEYTFYVRAVNGMGEGEWALVKATPEAETVITEPGTPGNLSVIVGDEEARLIWEAPASDGGSPILRYEVKKDDDSDWTDVGLTTGYTFINLTNGRQYTFMVRAVNSVGSGPVAGIEATPATRPSMPQNVVATPGDGQVTLSWDAPASDGGNSIIRYEVYKDGDDNWTAVGLNTSYTFTGLTNGVEYTFMVRAVNGAGSGEEVSKTAIPVAPPVPTYTVIVRNGTGSGEYPQNTIVTITADPAPEGKRFKEWQVISGEISLANPTESSISFIMPASPVEIAAVYEDIPIPTYTVTVNGSYSLSSGEGSYTQGEVVTIDAGSRENYSFSGWTSPDDITFANSNSTITTFIMPGKDVTIIAHWTYIDEEEEEEEEEESDDAGDDSQGDETGEQGDEGDASGDSQGDETGEQGDEGDAGDDGQGDETSQQSDEGDAGDDDQGDETGEQGNEGDAGDDDQGDEIGEQGDEGDAGDDDQGDETGEQGDEGDEPGEDGEQEVTTYNADIKMEDGTETVVPVEVDRITGTAYTDMESDMLAGGANITIPPIPSVDSYVVSIPVTDLTTTDAQYEFMVNTEIGSIAVPSDMLADTSTPDGYKVQITISRGDKSRLPDEIKETIGDRPLIQLTLSVDGNPVEWSNPNAPVTVSIPYTPTAEELANPESIVVWYIDGSGNAVCVPNGRYDSGTGTVTFTTTHFSYYAVNFKLVNFKDVTEDAWYAKAVFFAAARDITFGTGNGYFSPEAKVTRAQFLVMLMRTYGIVPDENPKNNFADAGNTWYTGYLATAKRLGISAGVGNNLFAPDKIITRQEMFAMLYNALKVLDKLPRGTSGKTLSDFSDAGDIDAWAIDAMKLLVETGMVSGTANRLSPTDTTTRAQMAQLFYNLLSK